MPQPKWLDTLQENTSGRRPSVRLIEMRGRSLVGDRLAARPRSGQRPRVASRGELTSCVVWYSHQQFCACRLLGGLSPARADQNGIAVTDAWSRAAMAADGVV